MSVGDLRFKTFQRLCKRRDFEKVKRHGRRVRMACFLVQALLGTGNQDSIRRCGIIATKRLGNAVMRNRAKRVFRELFRRNQEALPERCDLVVIPQPSIFDHSFADLEKLFLQACGSLEAKR